MTIYIEASIGELVDKITILKLKLEKLTDQEKLQNVQKEYDLLIIHITKLNNLKFQELYNDLEIINRNIWDVEENIRKHELKHQFDEDFIQLARSVYIFNDIRASIKKQINQLFSSTIIEEKSYEPYA